MKQILGFCAAIIGGILLPGGILAIILLVPSAGTPDGQYYGIPLEIGFLAAFFGFLLCYLAWALLHSAGSEDRNTPDTPKKRPPEERPCPNCGCMVSASSKTCENCGMDVNLS